MSIDIPFKLLLSLVSYSIEPTKIRTFRSSAGALVLINSVRGLMGSLGLPNSSWCVAESRRSNFLDKKYWNGIPLFFTQSKYSSYSVYYVHLNCVLLHTRMPLGLVMGLVFYHYRGKGLLERWRALTLGGCRTGLRPAEDLDYLQRPFFDSFIS